MSFIDFVTSPIAGALAWSLLHLIWEGAAVALALALTLSFARSARIRYGAACAALALVLAGFVITFTHLASENHGPLGPLPKLHPFESALVSGGPGALPTPAPAIDPAVWVVPLWIAGVLFFYLRAAGGWFSARRWRSSGVCAPVKSWQLRLNELTGGLGVSRPVLLLQSSLAEAPVMFGYLRPVILLPVGLLSGISPQQVEYILLHELAHIRRHDYLVNLFQTFIEGLLFYHPLVWWISGVIRTERENCCDDLVATCGNAHEYAAALATLEKFRQATSEPALAATGGNLMQRVRRLLLKPERPRAALTPIVSALFVLTAAGYGLAHGAKPTALPASVLSRPPAISVPTIAVPNIALPKRSEPALLAQARPAAQRPGVALDVESPWQKWVNEDVAYIITDQERDFFRSLTTNEERDMFVQQFWLRRDPTPGTVENEYKIEHYRRIAWTNQHFSVQSFPGWKTDRGRIYISFGPPDEIDSHPSGGIYTRPAAEGGAEVVVHPFEQWRYRFIEGMGTNVLLEFVDTNATGDFRMTMDPHAKEAYLQIREKLK